MNLNNDNKRTVGITIILIQNEKKIENERCKSCNLKLKLKDKYHDKRSFPIAIPRVIRCFKKNVKKIQ